MAAKFGFKNRIAVIGTMHQKEQVIAPILNAKLGVQVKVPPDFDTDQFGTFTREIKRWGTQVETARIKARKALEVTGEKLAIASEGAFFPHPMIPFLACDHEIVLLLDLENDLEIIGTAFSEQTNYAHKRVKSLDEALEFAEKIGFPSHGLVAMFSENLSTQSEIFKGIKHPKDLIDKLEYILKNSPDQTAHLETDMRAMHNPTRMRIIEQATLDLIQNINQTCPYCDCPGFNVVEQIKGLPCGLCNFPTSFVLANLYQCQKCNHQQQVLHPQGIKFADPSLCQYCNP